VNLMTVRRFRLFFLVCALAAFQCDSSAYAQSSAILAEGERASCPDFASKLTGREHEIAVLVARGYRATDIAHKLKISEWTVATHLRRIFNKLGVR
jgi:DNA-binding NarL/FixJ family response regulator